MPVPLRLRGPEGISTVQIELDDPATVADLQRVIFDATQFSVCYVLHSNAQIPPELQELKTGYPPRAVVLIPSLPISSLGLKRGDALVVASAPPRSNGIPATQPSASPSPSSPQHTARTTQPRDRMSTPVPIVSEATQPPIPRSGKMEYVPVDDSYLVLRVSPKFEVLVDVFETPLIFEQDIKAAQKLRQIVADAINADPDEFNAVFLGRPREEYISTILKPSAWGGAIELSILSDYYRTEISSFDVETGRCDRFGQGKYDTRAIVMYSGIHYDAISLCAAISMPPEFHQTVFPVSLASILDAAGKLAAKRRAKRAYTNTATFDLRCQVCRQGLKGEKEAREHAKDTGHVEFGEY